MRETDRLRLRKPHVVRFIVLVALVSGASSASGAAKSGEGESSVSLSVSPCPDLADETLERLLRIELGERLIDDPAKAIIRLHFSCEPTHVRVRLESTERAAQERLFSKGEARGEVGARTLSLKTVELLRQWEAVEPEQERAEDQPFELEEATSEERYPVRLSLGPEVLSFSFQDILLGGRLEADFLVAGNLRIVSGARALWGAQGFEEGQVKTRLLAGHLGLGLVSSRQSFEWGGEASFVLGQGSLRGTPQSDDQEAGRVEGLWGGPQLGATGAVVLGEGWLFKAQIEAGLPVFSVQGSVGESSQVSLNQVWFGSSLLAGRAW